MNNLSETFRMQFLSGIITESEYKSKLEENEQKGKLLYQMASWIVRKLGNPSTDPLSDAQVKMIILKILKLISDADFIDFIEINMGDGYVNDYIEKHGYEWPPKYADNSNL